MSAKMRSPLYSNAPRRSQRGKSTNTHKLRHRDNEIEILSPRDWPLLIWSVLLTRGIFCVVPPAGSFFLWASSLLCEGGVTNGLFFSLFLLLFALEKFLQEQRFTRVFRRCSFKVRAEKKTESKEGGMKIWAQYLCVCGRGGIKVSERQRSRNVAREVWWWAGALIAKDNSNMKKKDSGSSPSIILSLSYDPVGTLRTWQRESTVLRGENKVWYSVCGAKGTRQLRENKLQQMDVKSVLGKTERTRDYVQVNTASGRTHRKDILDRRLHRCDPVIWGLINRNDASFLVFASGYRSKNFFEHHIWKND